MSVHMCAYIHHTMQSLYGAALHVFMPIADPRSDHRISLCPMQFTHIVLRASSVQTQWQRKQFLWVRNLVFIGGCSCNYPMPISQYPYNKFCAFLEHHIMSLSIVILFHENFMWYPNTYDTVVFIECWVACSPLSHSQSHQPYISPLSVLERLDPALGVNGTMKSGKEEMAQIVRYIMPVLLSLP